MFVHIEVILEIASACGLVTVLLHALSKRSVLIMTQWWSLKTVFVIIEHRHRDVYTHKHWLIADTPVCKKEGLKEGSFVYSKNTASSFFSSHCLRGASCIGNFRWFKPVNTEEILELSGAVENCASWKVVLLGENSSRAFRRGNSGSVEKVIQEDEGSDL